MNFGFGFILNFEVDVFYFDAGVFEGFFDDVEKFGTELLDKEGIFDTNNNVAIVGRDEGSILKPGRKITRRNFLLNLS